MRKTVFRMAAWVLALILALACIPAAFAEDDERVPYTPYTLPFDMSGGAPFKASFKTNPEVYEDPTIRVEYHHMQVGVREDEDQNRTYKYFYAIVTIGHGSQLRTAAADPNNFVRGRMAPAVSMAKRVNAVLAIDGDFCNSYYGQEGSKYCLRQGTVYRDTVVDYLDMLLIDEDGDFHIYKGGPELADLNKEEIDGRKIINAFQFGPALVIDGEPVPDEYILDPAHSPVTSQPENLAARVCIAQIDQLQYLVFNNWYGLNLAQVRDLVMSLAPCKTVYVLDGGNSGQMVYLKSQVNENANNIRDIYDIIYFASAYFTEGE